jgi:hypothetical protein
MRTAPAVAVRGRGGWLWCGLHLALPALAGAALAAWAAALGGLPEPAILVLAAASALMSALWAWRRLPPVLDLHWTGQHWAADGAPGRLQLMVDPGFLLVLRLHLETGGERWLAISAAEAGPAWSALRAAVYSRPPRATLRVLSPERNTD